MSNSHFAVVWGTLLYTVQYLVRIGDSPSDVRNPQYMYVQYITHTCTQS